MQKPGPTAQETITRNLLKPQRGEIIHRLRFNIASLISLLQSSNLFLGSPPGALPQAFSFRAFGACQMLSRQISYSRQGFITRAQLDLSRLYLRTSPAHFGKLRA